MCRGNKIVFVCPSSLHDLFVCKSPASCLASTIQLVQFSVRFCCCGSVFFFRVEFTSLFRCSRFPCWFARHLQRWCIFQELLVTLGGLDTVGMYTFESCASRLVLLWLVLSHFPRRVCFSCTAFAGSSLIKDGVHLGDRDGFSLL